MSVSCRRVMHYPPACAEPAPPVQPASRPGRTRALQPSRSPRAPPPLRHRCSCGEYKDGNGGQEQCHGFPAACPRPAAPGGPAQAPPPAWTNLGAGLAADIQFGYTARPREGNLLLGQPVTWLGWPSSSVGRAED